jgi:hypothetical protein
MLLWCGAKCEGLGPWAILIFHVGFSRWVARQVAKVSSSRPLLLMVCACRSMVFTQLFWSGNKRHQLRRHITP